MVLIYILRSLRDGRFYVGSTTNLKSRLKHHYSGGTPTTRRFVGVELVFKQEYPTLEQAREVERKLKKLKRKDYLERIISDGFIKMGS